MTIVSTDNPSLAYPVKTKQLVKIFFVLIGYSLLFGLPEVLIFQGLKLMKLESGNFRSLLSLITYSLSLFYTIKYIAKRNNEGQSIYKLSDNYTFTAPVTILIIIATISLGTLLDPLTAFIPVPEWFDELMKNVISKDVFSLISVAIAAPFFEEWLCRGQILKALLEKYTPFKAILISSAFFCLIHLNPWQGIPAFFLGLFFGFLYYRCKSIWPCIIAHAANNALAFYVFFYLTPDKQSLLLPGHEYYGLLIGVSILLFACSFVFLKKTLPAHQ